MSRMFNRELEWREGNDKPLDDSELVRCDDCTRKFQAARGRAVNKNSEVCSQMRCRVLYEPNASNMQALRDFAPGQDTEALIRAALRQASRGHSSRKLDF